MKLYEEFKLYEHLWESLPNILHEDSDPNKLVTWFKEAGFLGTMKKGYYASLEGKNNHKLYVSVGSGSAQDVSFQVDGNQATFTYKDLSDITGNNGLFALNQTGIQLLKDRFFKISEDNAIARDNAYSNTLKAFILILASFSMGGYGLYRNIKDNKLNRYLDLQANHLAARLEKKLADKNLSVDVTNSDLMYKNSDSFPWNFRIYLKITNTKTGKEEHIDFTRNVGSYKNLRTILYGASEEEIDKFYSWNLDRYVNQILELSVATDSTSSKKENKRQEDKKATNNKETTEDDAKSEQEEKSVLKQPAKEDTLAKYKNNLDDMNDFLLKAFSESKNKDLITRAYNVLDRALEIIQQYKEGQY